MAIQIERGSAKYRTFQIAGFAALALVMAILPFVLPEFQVGRANRAMAVAVAVLGLNLVVGYSGLLALCQSAFIATGAFVTTSLVMDANFDYWMAIPFAMAGAFLISLIIGFPALKIKGLYLAMATISFAAAFPGLAKLEILTISERTGGVNGRAIDELLVPPGWAQGLGFKAEEPSRYQYFIILALFVMAFVGVNNLLKSRAGRAVVAIRDNEIGAAVSGVDLRRFKVINFGLSAALGGLAGAMWVMNTGFVSEHDFTFILMVELLVALVVGGVASLTGPIWGAIVVVFVREFAKNVSFNLPIPGIEGGYTIDGNGPLSQAIFGVILIAVVFYAPRGLAGLMRKLVSYIVRFTPRVPKLIEGTTSVSGLALEDVEAMN